MTLGASVIEVDLRGHDDREIRAALEYVGDATPGRYIRVHVGQTMPPLWLSRMFRPDLTWQFVGDTEKVLQAWEEVARYDETPHDPDPIGRDVRGVLA